jgi:hypothetical protein
MNKRIYVFLAGLSSEVLGLALLIAFIALEMDEEIGGNR